jgi:hypothetical protein
MFLNEDIKIIRDVAMLTPILVKTLTTLIYSLELVSYSSLGKVYVLPCRVKTNADYRPTTISPMCTLSDASDDCCCALLCPCSYRFRLTVIITAMHAYCAEHDSPNDTME